MFFAQGFVHAQERFWQMEYWRRIGSGRLSEIFGKKTLDIDIFLRTLGFERVAAQEYALMDKQTRSYLEAYAKGVNAYILDRPVSKLGLEFLFLSLQGVKFEIQPWTVINSLTWAKVMAFDLGKNLQTEIFFIELLREAGLDLTSAYFAPYRDDTMPYIIPDKELKNLGKILFLSLPREQIPWLTALDTTMVGNFNLNQGLALGTGSGIGSNSWVISGTLTKTGKPLLANDIHLSVQMPSIWYEVALHCSKEGISEQQNNYNAHGFSFPGVPGIICGHNKNIAWGITNLGGDAQDLYIEQINPRNPFQYRVNDKWADMEIIREEIKVFKQAESHVILVTKTRHGPILTNTKNMEVQRSFNVNPQLNFPDNTLFTALSLRWTALEPANMFKAIFMLNSASNRLEFQEALKYWSAPTINFVYADKQGNIGYQMAGLSPIRLQGDGSYPTPGWTNDYEWLGYIPFTKLPSLFNPEQGYIITANNPIISWRFPYSLGTYFAHGFRARRIKELIEQKTPGITIDDIIEIQADCLNPAAMEMISYLEDLVCEDPEVEKAKELLLKWDCQMQEESAEAVLFAFFWSVLIENTFQDQYPQRNWPASGSRLQNALYFLLQEPGNPWWDDRTTLDVVESRDEMLYRALEKGYYKAVRKYGSDFSKWRWGNIHTATFKNQTLGKSGIGFIEALFNRGPFGVMGGNLQINVAIWDISKLCEVFHIPTMRQIIDLNDLSLSLTIHTTGQSGHPGHSHYDDFIESWRKVEYHKILWQKREVETDSREKLVLEPSLEEQK